MENINKLTDNEIHELENLLQEMFEEINFDTIEQDENDNLIIRNSEIEKLTSLFYPERYSKDDKGNIKMSLSIFQVLRSRFFRNNQSIKFLRLSSKK